MDLAYSLARKPTTINMNMKKWVHIKVYLEQIRRTWYPRGLRFGEPPVSWTTNLSVVTMLAFDITWWVTNFCTRCDVQLLAHGGINGNCHLGRNVRNGWRFAFAVRRTSLPVDNMFSRLGMRLMDRLVLVHSIDVGVWQVTTDYQYHRTVDV